LRIRRSDDVSDDAILAIHVDSFKTNQQRASTFRVEPKLQLLHPKFLTQTNGCPYCLVPPGEPSRTCGSYFFDPKAVQIRVHSIGGLNDVLGAGEFSSCAAGEENEPVAFDSSLIREHTVVRDANAVQARADGAQTTYHDHVFQRSDDRSVLERPSNLQVSRRPILAILFEQIFNCVANRVQVVTEVRFEHLPLAFALVFIFI